MVIISVNSRLRVLRGGSQIGGGGGGGVNVMYFFIFVFRVIFWGFEILGGKNPHPQLENSWN